ncbi:class I SAM-dependent methyltransferase [Helicobacter sp. 16-1353]|uniref:class I SAM-dependent methyltransferase n=1 Tax=Helicobacter sp. 16-1353 TaxID=2004996 RepID=UPI0015EF3126|nr:class I SAM-dependent methyltransferase [Helicobacter sp. 16-1353]
MIKRDFKTINNHKVFEVAENEGDYKFSGFEELFRNEERHFWFIIRKEIIKKYMNKYVAKTAKIIDIGAGTGNVTRFLMQDGYENIAVGEMHLNALDYAKSYGISNRFCFNLLDSPFEDEFDCVCAFDVIEHIEDDRLAIENICKSVLDNSKANKVWEGGKYNYHCPSL